MFYIHQTSCISPQNTFQEVDLESVLTSVENNLWVKEPSYEIPIGLLRRMGKAVRIGVGAGLPLVKDNNLDGIVIGTANGGLEDCIKFLNQIVEYEEGRLTPTNFVQSTPNAVAGQLGLMSANKGYNITHTHRGLAFENALLDVAMLLKENPSHSYLLGGLDEISSYNNTLEDLGHWYKKEIVSSLDLYKTDSPGSLAGEGAAMFVVNNKPQGAVAKVEDMAFLHTADLDMVTKHFKRLVTDKKVDLLLTGENGDNRFTRYYEACENLVSLNTSVARYKHLSGEYPSSSSFALWLSCQLLTADKVPAHIIKKGATQPPKTILVYNTYKGIQHSIMRISAC
jgi:hypothetical protein